MNVQVIASPTNNFTTAALVAMPVARSRSLPVSMTNGLGVGAVLLAGAQISLVLALEVARQPVHDQGDDHRCDLGKPLCLAHGRPVAVGSIRSKTLREVCSIVDDGPAVLNIQEQQPRKPGNPAAMWRQAG
jgi:hypothetical protein